MKKIIPYKSSNEALTALDNGGRFYNIFTKAGDGVITQEKKGCFSRKWLTSTGTECLF